MLSPADLPNDIDALKALLLASERLLQERDEQLAGMAEQLNTRAVEIEHLKLQIAKLRRMQFGRKSEKLDHQIEQLELQLEDLQADEAEAAREMPVADQAPRKKSVRRPLPERLPRDEQVYAPTADACPACGGGLRPLGEDVAEQLELVPASSAMCAPNWRAPAATPSSKRRHRAGQSSAVSPVPACWRTFWWRSSPIICHCTASPSFTLAKALTWIVRCWRVGSARPARCCARWSTLFGAMCWRRRSCMPTIPRSRCWRPVMAKPRRRGYLMLRIFHLSHATRLISDRQVRDILATSHRNNPDMGVTGVLVHAGRMFDWLCPPA